MYYVLVGLGRILKKIGLIQLKLIFIYYGPDPNQNLFFKNFNL